MKKLTLILSAAAGFALSAAIMRAADAADNWTANCASCHGKDGAGKTRIAKRLGVKDLTDAAYQKSFTDDQAFKSLKEGEKDADGNVKMNPMGDKLSDDDIKGLVAYVRTLAK
ncbi:MAG: cytochrome c [Opitutaceae bacterium]|jgi:cytochrome c553